MVDDFEREELIVFASELGWMSLRMQGAAVGDLSFGHPSAAAAVQAMSSRMDLRTRPAAEWAERAPAGHHVPMVVVGAGRRVPPKILGRTPPKNLSNGQTEVVARLRRYAEGVPVDFCDLRVACDNVTEFQARVLKACREIPYGETITYGELAVAASAPGAARAVGNCMAGNRVPLIIPCHRVVLAGGPIGPYSAAGGSATKRRLLTMEAASFRESVRFLEGAAEMAHR
jgi:O-6-methylguanine DNA methyltransferase